MSLCAICPKKFLSHLRLLRAENGGPDDGFARFEGTLPDKGVQMAARNLRVNKQFHHSDMMLRYHDRADWFGVDPLLRQFAGRFIFAARKVGVPLYVHTALRTAAEQKRLRALGRSKLGAARAPHCKGAAVDIVHGRHHWQMSSSEWAYLGHLGKEVARKLGAKLEWGGDWDFYDPAHWQLVGWASRPTIKEQHEPIHMAPGALIK